MSSRSSYTGVKAGAIASGLLIAGLSFLVLSMVLIFLVVLPEGGPRNVQRENYLLIVGLIMAAMISCWLGWRVKRFFDRRAGRT